MQARRHRMMVVDRQLELWRAGSTGIGLEQVGACHCVECYDNSRRGRHRRFLTLANSASEIRD